jgi:hypothetical protein
VLFGEQVPYFRTKGDVVRIARTAVFESGCEYIVQRNAHFREPVRGDVVLSPTTGFIEKHRPIIESPSGSTIQEQSQ